MSKTKKLKKLLTMQKSLVKIESQGNASHKKQ